MDAGFPTGDCLEEAVSHLDPDGQNSSQTKICRKHCGRPWTVFGGFGSSLITFLFTHFMALK